MLGLHAKVRLETSSRLISVKFFFVSFEIFSEKLGGMEIDQSPATPPPPPPPLNGIADQPAPGGPETTVDANGHENEAPADEGGFKLKFCTVCASNNNRFVPLILHE